MKNADESLNGPAGIDHNRTEKWQCSKNSLIPENQSYHTLDQLNDHIVIQTEKLLVRLSGRQRSNQLN